MRRLHSRRRAAPGTSQREGEVRNRSADHLEDLTPLLGWLAPDAAGIFMEAEEVGERPGAV